MPDIATTLSILDRLIAFDTTSRNSNLALVEWIEDFLAEQGVTARRVSNRDGTKANLIATIGPPQPGGVILSGHSDVVPVDGQSWSTDPWKLTEREGKLYGRGTADMKSFIAAALACTPFFKTAGKPVHLAISYDEEVGCLGAPALIDEIRRTLPDPSLAIIGEPSLMRLIDGHKGVAVYDVEITGHEAHSSLVDHGLSANAVAIELMHELTCLSAQLAADANRDNGFDPPQATLTIGQMRGGTAANILAGRASFRFDLRCPPGQNPEQILQGFLAHCSHRDGQIKAAFTNCGIDVTQLASAPPLAPGKNGAALTFVRKLTGDNAPPARVAYAAEAGQFQQAGFASVICGPGSIEQAHQPDEWIAVEQIERGVAFMHRLAEELGAA